MKWIVLLAFFFFSFVLYFWLARYLELRRGRIAKRVHEIEKKEWQLTEELPSKSKSKEKRSFFSSIFERMFRNIKWLNALENKMLVELKRANLLMKPSEFMALIVIFAFAGALLGTMIAGGHIERGVWIGGITWVLPLIWLKNKIKKRKKLLENQLPEMVNMTSNSLKAGYSLIQSLDRKSVV